MRRGMAVAGSSAFFVAAPGVLAGLVPSCARYEAYRRAVPAWRPRLRPWHPSQP